MVSQDATIIVGTAVDENMKDEIKVTLIATGLNAKSKRGMKSEAITSSVSSTVSAPKPLDFGTRTPSFSASDDDDAIFSRTLKGSMENINVPSFFKPKNN
jgi:cell division protein FtsZ